MQSFEKLMERMGYVKLDRYGLVRTPDDRILALRPVLDDGLGGTVVGWQDGDLAAMELGHRTDRPQRPAPKLVEPPPRPPTPPRPPEPAAAVPPPEEEDWEWQIVAARARAAADAITQPMTVVPAPHAPPPVLAMERVPPPVTPTPSRPSTVIAIPAMPRVTSSQLGNLAPIVRPRIARGTAPLPGPRRLAR